MSLNNLFCFRNLSKKHALGGLHIAVLVFKILNDCVGKSLLAFAFIYSTGAGRFSTIRTLATFYSIAGIMMIFHTIFNKAPARELCSIRHWIGENGLFSE